MRVLIACEFSGTVRDFFAEKGHEVWSCDLLPTEKPGLHFQGDVKLILDGWVPVRFQCQCDPEGNGICRLTELDTSECKCIGPVQDGIEYKEQDRILFGRPVRNPNWDLMIAFPPCTYLCSSGLHWNKRVPGRTEKTQEALEFVKTLLDAPINQIAIENPIGCISTKIRKPDQIIQPYMFGHPESKGTCLWLKNLPKLVPTNILEKPNNGVWSNQTPTGQNKLGPSKDRWKIRSKTYEGIARAMSEQWC